MKKSKNDTDYNNITVFVNNMIIDKYGITARITRIWEFILNILSLDEFSFLDMKTINPLFESWLIDNFIDWSNGKEIDFSEVRQSILNAGSFSSKEKLLIDQDEFDEMLWGIYLAINPGQKLKLNNNN
jgi:hypothetical protein